MFAPWTNIIAGLQQAMGQNRNQPWWHFLFSFGRSRRCTSLCALHPAKDVVMAHGGISVSTYISRDTIFARSREREGERETRDHSWRCPLRMHTVVGGWVGVIVGSHSADIEISHTAWASLVILENAVSMVAVAPSSL